MSKNAKNFNNSIMSKNKAYLNNISNLRREKLNLSKYFFTDLKTSNKNKISRQ